MLLVIQRDRIRLRQIVEMETGEKKATALKTLSIVTEKFMEE
jgi:hypothetical protein